MKKGSKFIEITIKYCKILLYSSNAVHIFLEQLITQGFGVICDGDSGGPMVVRRKTGSYALLGVASFGTDKDCSKVGEAAVYTSVYYYLPWISHFVDVTYI